MDDVPVPVRGDKSAKDFWSRIRASSEVSPDFRTKKGFKERPFSAPQFPAPQFSEPCKCVSCTDKEKTILDLESKLDSVLLADRRRKMETIRLYQGYNRLLKINHALSAELKRQNKEKGTPA